MSAGINFRDGHRRYSQIIKADGWEGKVLLRDCPEKCPECEATLPPPYTINVYNGLYDTGGEGVTCECGYREFQVVDTWMGKYKR